MNEIDVAVAIVSYKSAQLTIDCLHSIEAERCSEEIRIRVIVVDNASGDAPSIAEAIEKNSWSSWVTLVQAPRNGGFAYGNNLSISDCAGRWIAGLLFTCLTLTHFFEKGRSGRWFNTLRHTKT